MSNLYLGTLPRACDICMIPFKEAYIHKVGYFVDGKTKHGPWANMCSLCHKDHGIGLGLGKGQKYSLKTREKIGPISMVTKTEETNG